MSSPETPLSLTQLTSSSHTHSLSIEHSRKPGMSKSPNRTPMFLGLPLCPSYGLSVLVDIQDRRECVTSVHHVTSPSHVGLSRALNHRGRTKKGCNSAGLSAAVSFWGKPRVLWQGRTPDGDGVRLVSAYIVCSIPIPGNNVLCSRLVCESNKTRKHRLMVNTTQPAYVKLSEKTSEHIISMPAVWI